MCSTPDSIRGLETNSLRPSVCDGYCAQRLTALEGWKQAIAPPRLLALLGVIEAKL